MRVPLSVVLMFFSAALVAEGQGSSIMFKEQKNEYKHLTTVPEDRETALGEKCIEMSRQIDALKGKPQRRHALMERYRLECRDRP